MLNFGGVKHFPFSVRFSKLVSMQVTTGETLIKLCYVNDILEEKRKFQPKLKSHGNFLQVVLYVKLALTAIRKRIGDQAINS